jgi:hypothetical protein
VMYMRRRLREYCRGHGRTPQNRKGWRTWCTDGLVQLLRLIHAQWPPPRPARSPASHPLQIDTAIPQRRQLYLRNVLSRTAMPSSSRTGQCRAARA